MSSQGAKKPTEEEWLLQKPTLKELYLDTNKKLLGRNGVKEIMEQEHSFHATKSQYEKRFKDWKWKKNNKSEHWEQLSDVIHERKRFGKETDVFIRGQLQSRDKIRKEISRYHPPIQQRLSFTSTQQLPAWFRVQTPPLDNNVLDRYVPLTVDLPFRILEDSLRVKVHRPGYQEWSWPALPAVPPNINPRLTLERPCGEEDLYPDSSLGFDQQIGTLEQPPSVEVSSTMLAASDNWTPDSSVLTALKSVVPNTIIEEDTPSPSVGSLNMPIFTSSLHRQILFSVANNFVGLDAVSPKDIFHYLRKERDETLYRLIGSARYYSSRAIVVNLFKAAIEAGDARIVDVLIRENPRDIEINKLLLSFEGDTYTPIERATMLGYEDVIKTLLKRGADVNRTYSDNKYRHGALDCLVYSCHARKGRVNSQTFSILHEAGGILSHYRMFDLIRLREGELVLLVMTVNASKMAAEWDHRGILRHVMNFLDDDTSMKIVGIMWNYGAELNRYIEFNRDIELGEAIDVYDVTTPHRVVDFAARVGKNKTVKLLLDIGASLTGDTLPLAIASGNKDLIRLLLTRGADINSIRSGGTTPLSAAIELQDADVLSLVENHGAFDTMQKQEHLSAALKAASNVGNMQIIERLIQKGGKVNPRSLGYALIGAIRAERDEYVKMLIDAGADINIENGAPLSEALERRKEAIVLWLLDADADPDYRVHNSSSTILPMILAVEWGNRSVMRNLIFAGADVNDHYHFHDGTCQYGSGKSETALTIAVKRQDHGLIQFLLASGADINNFTSSTDCSGEDIPNDTALQAAAEIEDVEMARFLLDQGADPKDPAALNQAAYKNNEMLFDLLFERYKARYPTSRGKFGTRILATAVVEGNERLTKMLLDKKVNPSAMIRMCDDMSSPFGYAVARQHGNFTRILELFLQNGCHPNDVVAKARGRDFNLNSYNEYGHIIADPRVTALLAAIGTLNISTVELFIRHEADVNFPTRGPIKRTPLQRAAEVGSLDIVDLLLDHGANVHAPAAERGGGTALQLAAMGGYIPIAYKLLSHNADPNAPASKVNGRTALEGAAEHGRLDMIQVLLNAGAASKRDDEAQIKNAIALAEENGYIPICDLLDSHLKSVTQGSALGSLAESKDGDHTNFSPDDDPFSSFMDFEGDFEGSTSL